MNILEIYQKYHIMPQLAEHQLRVAAVGELICDNLDVAADKHNVVAALLLHDMGNIVKFDFSPEALRRLPGLVDPAKVSYWEQVRQEYVSRYGSSDSHVVTTAIVRVLGVSDRILALVDSVGFEEGKESARTGDLERKICSYSDQRVAPLGVTSLEGRMADLRVRYRSHPEGRYNREEFESAMRRTEQQIFVHCDIKPEDITEQAITGRKEKLREFQI